MKLQNAFDALADIITDKMKIVLLARMATGSLLMQLVWRLAIVVSPNGRPSRKCVAICLRGYTLMGFPKKTS